MKSIMLCDERKNPGKVYAPETLELLYENAGLERQFYSKAEVLEHPEQFRDVDPVAKAEETKAKDMQKRLFEYYVTHPEALPEDFHPQRSFGGMERTVCDYIAGMTDNYAIDNFEQIFIPVGWNVRG